MNSYNFKIIKHKNFYEIKNREKNIFILTRQYTFGENISWEKDIRICNTNLSPMENLFIGDNVFIGHSTTIIIPSFEVYDYTKINNHFYTHGNNPLTIGYNCWFGSSVILDTLGGLKVGNNVGVGNQAQIYSHAKFGDTLYGCRIHSYTAISIGDDVWIAPNSIITSASMAPKSMLLAGSVLTKSTQENYIYGGSPTRDVTQKTGTQFNTNLDYKKILNILTSYLNDFYKVHKKYKRLDLIKIEMEMPKKIESKYSYFIVKERKYIKRGTEPEVTFMKFLLPEKAKFIPY